MKNVNEMQGVTLGSDHHRARIQRLALEYCFLNDGFNAGAEITDHALSEFARVSSELIRMKQQFPELFTPAELKLVN